MGKRRKEPDNCHSFNPDGSLAAFNEIGPDARLHSERNRLVKEFAYRQLPEGYGYGLPVRYVDEIGSDPVDGEEFRAGIAVKNDPYNPGMVTEILIDKYAFIPAYLKGEFKGIELDWKDVVLHECGHAAYLDFMPSIQGPIVLDGGYLMNEYYAMRAAARLPGAATEPERVARLNAAAELYLRGELR